MSIGLWAVLCFLLWVRFLFCLWCGLVFLRVEVCSASAPVGIVDEPVSDGIGIAAGGKEVDCSDEGRTALAGAARRLPDSRSDDVSTISFIVLNLLD